MKLGSGGGGTAGGDGGERGEGGGSDGIGGENPPGGAGVRGGDGGIEGDGGKGGWSGIGVCGSTKVLVQFVPSPPLQGVELYSHVGGTGGGGGGELFGGAGGADGGAHVPSQSTMYSTYTRWPSCGFSFTSGVAVVTNVYVLSPLGGRST